MISFDEGDVFSLAKHYWWIIATYILTLFSGIIGIPAIYLLFQFDVQTIAIYYQIISFIIGAIVVLILLKPDMKMDPHPEAASWNTVILWSILGVFMAYFAQMIAVYIETMIIGVEIGSENTGMIMNISRSFPLFMIVPALVAPFLEEIVFRKIIFGTLYKKSNFIIAALASSFIFGIIHGEPEHVLIYSSMGLVFAYLYVKTKRIIVPIIVHMSMNTITIIAQYNLTPEDIERMQQQLEQLKTIIFIGG